MTDKLKHRHARVPEIEQRAYVEDAASGEKTQRLAAMTNDFCTRRIDPSNVSICTDFVKKCAEIAAKSLKLGDDMHTPDTRFGLVAVDEKVKPRYAIDADFMSCGRDALGSLNLQPLIPPPQKIRNRDEGR